MSTTRRCGLAAPAWLAGVVLALVATMLGTGSVGADGRAALPSHPGQGADDVALTFDWPLDCDVVVQQAAQPRSDMPATLASYTVRVTEGGIAGNLVVRFGTAELHELGVPGGGFAELEPGTTSAFLTNPAIEIDRTGLPVAYGYEEWVELRLDDPDDPADAAVFPPVEHRLGVATWPTWVSLWTQLGAVNADGAERSAPVVFVNEDGSTIDLELTATAEPASDGTVLLYGSWTLDAVTADLLVITDAATLRPTEATYEYSLLDPVEVIDRYDWTFDWSACDDAVTVGELPPPSTAAPSTTAPATTSTTPAITAVTVPGFRTIHVDDLPLAALDTLDLIASGGPFPYRQDDTTFGNREGLLPRQPHGYYREYTVETPGLSHRGARRIVAGDGGELFYTDDHYDSFRVIVY